MRLLESVNAESGEAAAVASFLALSVTLRHLGFCDKATARKAWDEGR